MSARARGGEKAGQARAFAVRQGFYDIDADIFSNHLPKQCIAARKLHAAGGGRARVYSGLSHMRNRFLKKVVLQTRVGDRVVYKQAVLSGRVERVACQCQKKSAALRAAYSIFAEKMTMCQ